MVTRDRLNCFLADLYRFDHFDDYCFNGLQVEGKEEINKIMFGVSFHLPLLERAIQENADALIVHHGIFGKDFFKLTGPLKRKIKCLLDRDISLFGVHLPMDGHPELGHNALLLRTLGVGGLVPIEPVRWVFHGENTAGHTLNEMVDILHRYLHPVGEDRGGREAVESDVLSGDVFSLSRRHRFDVLANGPDIPRRVAVISGAACNYYENIIENGVDTFFCGDIKEHIPAMSHETGTNFVNLGHYFSEKPGVLALQALLEKEFAVETGFIEIPNPV